MDKEDNFLKDILDEEMMEELLKIKPIAMIRLKELVFKRISSAYESGRQSGLREAREALPRFKMSFRGENCSCHINPPCSACENVNGELVEDFNHTLSLIESAISNLISEDK